MKKLLAICFAFLFVPMLMAAPNAPAPLKLIQTFKVPNDVKGNFDHFAVDLQHNRLFATATGSKAVLVFDVRSGKLLQVIHGIGKPHAVLYRNDLERIYVTDGEEGDLKIFDSKTYKLIKSVKLLADADSIGYDPASKYLYIDNGGGDVHETYSMVSVVDTSSGEKVGDIKVDGETLEAMALETSSPKIYINNKAKNQVAVVDRERRSVIGSWPITKGKTNVAMALDEANHRLFVACRSGQIVVFDTASGKELQALPIGEGVDDLVFDAASKRLYAATGGGTGSIAVYRQRDADHYESLGSVPSGALGRTGRLVPQLKRYFVAVPAGATEAAKVLVYQVQ